MILALLLGLGAGCQAGPSAISIERPEPARIAPSSRAYQGYWLSRTDPGTSCEACYMPLLLVRGPLEELRIPVEPVATSSGRAATRMTPDELLLQPSIYVITYEKDSIWNTDCAPFKLPSGITAVRAEDRTVVMDGVRYRYDAARRAAITSGVGYRPMMTTPAAQKRMARLSNGATRTGVAVSGASMYMRLATSR